MTKALIRTHEQMKAWLDYIGGGEITPMLKTNYPLLMATARNINYGTKAAMLTLTEANQAGVLPKRPYDKGGTLIKTAHSRTANLGVAEAAAMRDVAKPTLTTMYWPPKMAEHTFSETEFVKATQGKDMVYSWDDYVQDEAQTFAYALNADLLGTADTVAGYDFESVDRLIGSYAEIAYGKVADNAALDASDLDPWTTINRDGGATVYDAYVNGQAYASGSRTFDISILNALFSNCSPYWGSNGTDFANKVIVTGRDTWERINDYYEANSRYWGQTRAAMTVNGIRTNVGADSGAVMSTYRNVPVFTDAGTLQDTISRIYLEDLNHLWISMASPIEFGELGRDIKEQMALGYNELRGQYRCLGETVADMFKCHGKARDLK